MNWRPPARVRAIAIAIVRRNAEILVMRVRNDAGVTTGWRPPGGAIELGEPEDKTVARELDEELAVKVAECTFTGVLENIYAHALESIKDALFPTGLLRLLRS